MLLDLYFFWKWNCFYYIVIFISGEFYGMDHDAFQHAVTDWCLEQSGHQLPEEGTYESQVTSNVYNLHMGQMTLYRYVALTSNVYNLYMGQMTLYRYEIPVYWCIFKGLVQDCSISSALALNILQSCTEP